MEPTEFELGKSQLDSPHVLAADPLLHVGLVAAFMVWGYLLVTWLWDKVKKWGK